MLAQNPFALTSEEHRAALLAQSVGGAGARMSIRFGNTHGHIGVDAQGARFIEQACRASLGAGDRALDIAGEIDRLYLKAA